MFSRRLAVFAQFPGYFLELELLRRVPVVFFAADLRVEDFAPPRALVLLLAAVRRPVDFLAAVLRTVLRPAVFFFGPAELRLVVEARRVPAVFFAPELLLRPAAVVFFAAFFAVPALLEVLFRDAAAFRPPFFAGSLFVALPLPEPLFFPPPSIAFTVAQALLSASSVETPLSL